MEIRLAIDENFMRELQEQLNEGKASEVTRSALTLLKWAAEEAKQGRVILSAQPDGKNVQRLAMPALSKISKAS